MKAKANFFRDNPDIGFHLRNFGYLQELYPLLTDAGREVLGVQNVDEFQETWLEVLTTFGEAIGTEIAPKLRQVENEKLSLDEEDNLCTGAGLRTNIRLLQELGFAPLGGRVEYGGMGAPFIVLCSLFEILVRACPSTALNVVWHGVIAEVIERFGTQTLKDTYNLKLSSGEWSGCMALTEPETGSDLSAISSYSEKQADGSYLLSGTKRFITNGTADISLVLAKSSKGAAGLHNLSLYLVPRVYQNKRNYRVAKPEEKLGLRGSATCDLHYQEAHAHLLGEENKGLSYMLVLMNGARIYTAFQGVGSLEAITRLAKTYANERVTWGKKIAQHELIAEKLQDMEMDLCAIRSLAYKASFRESYVEMAQARLQNADLQPEERQRLQKKINNRQRRLRQWIPLIKYWVGENVVRHARNALQIHGGYGYMQEYPAELWFRSTMILSIYEGTSQIQAMMCMKDTLKDILRRPTAFIENALALNVKVLSEDRLRKKLNRAKKHVNAALLSIMYALIKKNFATSISKLQWKELLRGMERLKKNIKMQDFSYALLNAERICEMKCHVALAEALVWDTEIDQGRSAVAHRYLDKALPRLACLKAEVDASSGFLP